MLLTIISLFRSTARLVLRNIDSVSYETTSPSVHLRKTILRGRETTAYTSRKLEEEDEETGMRRGTGGRSRSRWSAVRYTPPQTYGSHCVPLGAHTPGRGARRFYRRRRDTRRDTPAFMDPTPCFFSVKRCARGNLETVESQFSARCERVRVYSTTGLYVDVSRKSRENRFAQMNSGTRKH